MFVILFSDRLIILKCVFVYVHNVVKLKLSYDILGLVWENAIKFIYVNFKLKQTVSIIPFDWSTDMVRIQIFEKFHRHEQNT